MAKVSTLLFLTWFCALGFSSNTRAEQKKESWREFLGNYLEQSFKANPNLAVSAGRHEFDGLLPDWSDAGLSHEIARLKKTIVDANRYEESALSHEEKFEKQYLMAQVKGELFWRDIAERPLRNPAYYMDNGLDPSVYATRPYASVETRLKAYIKYLRAIPKAVHQIRANLKAPLPLVFIDYGKSAFGGFADYYLGDGKKAFADAQNAVLQKELEEAAKPAATAMLDLVKWMESQRQSAKQDFALGSNQFAQMLRDTEMVDVPLEELEAIGRADLKRNQETLANACAVFSFGSSIADCVNKMAADKPSDGSVVAARKQLVELKAFIEKNNVVTIPGNEQALVEEAPSYNRQNFAFINIAGPFEKGMPSVYNISPPDSTWSKEVQDAFVPGKASLMFTSVHEVWPGHFLQFLHANRSKFMFGRIYVGYAFAEGWAHYGEEMMWESGLANGDAEAHIGQIIQALLRDCRFLSAIGMHTGKMTLEESRKLFREQCYAGEGTARQQSARGAYDPAYLNYTMGKLMIRKLREDWTKTRGGKKAWKEFHDAFLSYGGPPIPLVRGQMMGSEPKAVF